MDIIQEVKTVFDTEIEALVKVRDIMDDSIVEAVNMIYQCTGKVAICGMGKPGHIACKISASMSSMGIPAFVLHPAEAQHGDLGVLDIDDIIIIISNSGETAEICAILPNLKIIGIPIIAITSRNDSTLAQYAECTISTEKVKEASNLGLAPTSSTTVELVIGDAIAVVVSKMKKFKKENFALFHPAGTLGKKLLTKVSDLMITGQNLPFVYSGATYENAISVLAETSYGAIVIVASDMKLKGIFTDGDFKRFASNSDYPRGLLIDDVMTNNPISIKSDELAIEALKLMEKRKHKIHCIAVTDATNKVVGLIRNHDVIDAGIFV